MTPLRRAPALLALAVLSLMACGKKLDPQRSVVVVRTGSSVGTGFFVMYGNRLFVVTAFHVIAGSDQVLIEKEYEADDGTYKRLYRAEVAAADFDRDLAVLRFPKHFPAPIVEASPLDLMSDDELRRASGSVRAWGSTEDNARPGMLTKIHSESAELSSSLGRVNIVDAFTGDVVMENNPNGFSLSKGVFPGFSGGPVLLDGSPGRVLGVTIARAEGRHGQSASVVVAATEIVPLLRGALDAPFAEDIDNAEKVRPRCEESLRDVIALMKPVTVAADVSPLLSGQGLFSAGYGDHVKSYRRISPASRDLLLSKSKTETQLMGELTASIMLMSATLGAEFDKFDRAHGAHPCVARARQVKRGVVCEPVHCTRDVLCFGTLLIQLIRPIIGLLAASGKLLAEKADQITHWTYAQRMMRGIPQEVHKQGSVYDARLRKGTIVSGTRGGEQAVFFRYELFDDAKSNPSTVTKMIDFEFAQGQCLVSLERL